MTRCYAFRDDQWARIETLLPQGIRQEGLQKALEEKHEIARQLLKNGVDKKIIQQSTGLSEAQLNTLCKD
ncbi:MAG: hypothetical protein ACL7AX_04500 [Candidatus Arsenophonus phytopathogenicus]